MNLLVWLCILSIATPVVAGVVYGLLYGSTPERRAPLYEALRAFAREQGAAIVEQVAIDKIQCQVPCQIAGTPCEVHLGWHGSDFRLRLSVEDRAIKVEAFEECWERSWVRYLKRDYDQRIQVTGDAGRLTLSGPAHALRETFAEAGRDEMALLFGVPLNGPSREFRRLVVRAGLLALEIGFPGPEHLQDLAPRLAAAVRLAKFRQPPFTTPPASPSRRAGPQLVEKGTVTVTVQAGQRCAYCRESLVGGDVGPVKTCAACNSSLHAVCLEEHGGCCTVGCRNNPRS